MQPLRSRLLELSSGHSRALVYPEQGFQLYAFDVKEAQRVTRVVHASDGPFEPWDRRHGNPILFPSICESFAGEQRGAWLHDGKPLLMPLHGWARDLYFYVEERTESSVTARMARPHTFAAAFPFELELILRYSVESRSLTLSAEVHNTGSVPFPYALGFHPYLRAPLTQQGTRGACKLHLPAGTRITSPDSWRTLHTQEFSEQTLSADHTLLNEGIVLRGTSQWSSA